MILSGLEIRKRLGNEIIIEPFSEKYLNPNSYNLRLHNELLIYEDDVLDMKKHNKTRSLTIPEEGLGKGIGNTLFKRVVVDAKKSGCTWLKVETQNNNVSANKFYKSQGCHLAQVHLHAYYDVPECKDEAMIIWFLNLIKDRGNEK